MTRTPVESSNIVSVGYDAAQRYLEIEFKPKKGETAGAVYGYADVPEEAYDALVNARSVGSTFHHIIRPVFTGRKLTENTDGEK